MSKTICVLVQVSDTDSKKAWVIARALANACDSVMGSQMCGSWRTAFPYVTNQDLIRTLNTPLMQIEDGKESR